MHPKMNKQPRISRRYFIMVSLVFVLALAACAKQGQQILDSFDPTASHTSTEYPTETPRPTETSTPSTTPTVTETSTPTLTPTPDIQATRIAAEEEYDGRLAELDILFPETLRSSCTIGTIKISEGLAESGGVEKFIINNSTGAVDFMIGNILFPHALRQALLTDGSPLDGLERYMVENGIIKLNEHTNEMVDYYTWMYLKQGDSVHFQLGERALQQQIDQSRYKMSVTGTEVDGIVNYVDVRLIKMDEFNSFIKSEPEGIFMTVNVVSSKLSAPISRKFHYSIYDNSLRVVYAHQYPPDVTTLYSDDQGSWDTTIGPSKIVSTNENRRQDILTSLSMIADYGATEFVPEEMQSETLKLDTTFPSKTGSVSCGMTSICNSILFEAKE